MPTPPPATTISPPELAFAEELLADPESAARWVPQSDQQRHNPQRLVWWAEEVVRGTHRTEASYWGDAAPAFARWLAARDARNGDAVGARPDSGAESAPRAIPGDTRDDIFADALRLLERLVDYIPSLTPEALEPWQRTAGQLRERFDAARRES